MSKVNSWALFSCLSLCENQRNLSKNEEGPFPPPLLPYLPSVRSPLFPILFPLSSLSPTFGRINCLCALCDKAGFIRGQMRSIYHCWTVWQRGKRRKNRHFPKCVVGSIIIASPKKKRERENFLKGHFFSSSSSILFLSSFCTTVCSTL